MVILYLLGIIISGGILISFFTSGNYDTGKKSVSNTLSIQAANKNTLCCFICCVSDPILNGSF